MPQTKKLHPLAKYENRAIRPEGYPILNVTFQSFKDELSEVLVSIKPFSTNELNDLYGDYKEHNYHNLSLDWINKHGYETVQSWAKWFFSHWDAKTTGIILKNVQ